MIATALVTGAGAALLLDAGAALVLVEYIVPLVGEVTPAVGWAEPLTGDISVLAALPSLLVAGVQGAALAADAAVGVVVAVFFFPKSDPRLEKAALAFETVLLALAGTGTPAEFAAPVREVAVVPHGGNPEAEDVPCPCDDE